MGQTRLAFVVKREDRGVVAESLVALGVRAFIAQQSGHPVVVFPDQFETNEFQLLRELGVGLSKDLNCIVLAVGRVSSDPLWIGLFESGRLVLDYDSAVWQLPWREYAITLGDAFSRRGRWLILRFLLMSRLVRSDYLRQWLILRQLGLPNWIGRYSYPRLLESRGDLMQQGVDVQHT